MLLIEICCRCGTCHRDDRSGYRSVKAHFHWMPKGGEVCVGFKDEMLRIHATVCTACILKDAIDWPQFFEAQRTTPARYQALYAFNAPLPPDLWSSSLDAAYETFAHAFERHLGSSITRELECQSYVFRVFFERSSSKESTFTQTVTIQDAHSIPKSLAAFAPLLSAEDVVSVTRVERVKW